MKATGTVRKVDPLGRLVLPVNLRESIGIAEGTELEMYVDGEYVYLKKYMPACIFCGEPGNKEFKGKLICQSCLQDLKKRA